MDRPRRLLDRLRPFQEATTRRLRPVLPPARRTKRQQQHQSLKRKTATRRRRWKRTEKKRHRFVLRRHCLSPQPSSCPPTPIGLAGTSSSFEYEDRGDLILFYNTVYVRCLQAFALKFSNRNRLVIVKNIFVLGLATKILFIFQEDLYLCHLCLCNVP